MIPVNPDAIPVILESPYAGDVEGNLAYLQRCIRDSLGRGEAPFASHLLYTQALDDRDPAQREAGIRAGFAWRMRAVKTVVYGDRGISRGMQLGIEHARSCGHVVEYRHIDNQGAA